MPPRNFGEILGIPPGTLFESREALARAAVHRPVQAGISGSALEGADSIVLSGGYEDDLDEGSWIVYTGQGGNEPSTRRQIADQELTRGNLALAKSADEGLPVRVVRGDRHPSKFSPQSGYRYEGLFFVERYWHDTGRSGFRIYRYLLRSAELYVGADPEVGRTVVGVADRRSTTIQRVVRTTAIATEVKKLNDYHCQVCITRLNTQSGPYAEGAHVRPLGRPHNGPDALDNILCLCPNHHVLFDRGAFAVRDDLTLIGLEGQLRTAKGHVINRAHLDYHRKHYASIKIA